MDETSSDAMGSNDTDTLTIGGGNVTFSPAVADTGFCEPAASIPATTSYPRASLLCRPNSHPFQDRHISLEQSAKVGRSVARARPTPNNVIFDCKVLSRNHALLWYEGGKFYLQDTKSSNGTFINNQRLSKGSEESLPREVCSGDILQFGVDVMENSRKVTHGCIIATLRLFLPDGKEAKASPTIMSSPSLGPLMLGAGLPVSDTAQDLFQLNQYIQEALAREQLLETKLAILQRLVGQTESASSDAWKSLIDEDRLLTRVEILESQLSAYSKSMTADKLREETGRLMQEKEVYQEAAKETMKKLVDEKLEAVKKFKDLEKILSSAEDEFAIHKDLYERNLEESKKLLSEVSRLETELEECKKKLPPASEDPPLAAASSEVSGDGDQSASSSEPNAVEKLETELALTRAQVEQRESELGLVLRRCDELEQHNQLVSGKLLEQTQQAEALLEQEVDGLRAALALSQEENERLQAQLHADREDERVAANDDALDISSDRLSDHSAAPSEDLNRSLQEAQDKITALLKVKEKFVEVSQHEAELELNLSRLESDVEALSLQSQAATACSVIPLAILLLAVIVAFLPLLSSVFGTADDVATRRGH